MEIEILPFKIQGAEWKLKFCPLKSRGHSQNEILLVQNPGGTLEKKVGSKYVKKYYCLTFLL